NPKTLGKQSLGEVTEWSIVQHWKCCVFRKGDRGFESPPLRCLQQASVARVRRKPFDGLAQSVGERRGRLPAQSFSSLSGRHQARAEVSGTVWTMPGCGDLDGPSCSAGDFAAGQAHLLGELIHVGRDACADIERSEWFAEIALQRENIRTGDITGVY